MSHSALPQTAPTFLGSSKYFQELARKSLPAPAPGPRDYLWKRQGCFPNITTTLLPAFRLVPVMVTWVPPDMGPRLGFRSESVRVCAGKDKPEA